MMRMILTHITVFILLSVISWAVLKGFEVLTGNVHEVGTIFMTTLIVSFFIMFTGYSEEDEEEDNE